MKLSTFYSSFSFLLLLEYNEKMSRQLKLLHSEEDIQESLLRMDTRDLEQDMIELHVIHNSDREYVDEEYRQTLNGIVTEKIMSDFIKQRCENGAFIFVFGFRGKLFGFNRPMLSGFNH